LKVIVALDFDDCGRALSLVDDLKGIINHFKVGLELFSRCGMGIVKEIKERGCEVFLDLKYFDIPNTVKSAARVAIESGVWMYNVHSLGGYEFLKEIAEFNAEYSEKLGVRRPILVGVTVLTSIDGEDLRSVGINLSVEETVLRLAELSKKAGLDGVVCSAKEAGLIKEKLGKGFLTVTPGIRPLWSKKDDQKRVVTPAQAVKLGADYIVVGRPITLAEDPRLRATQIVLEVFL